MFSRNIICLERVILSYKRNQVDGCKRKLFSGSFSILNTLTRSILEHSRFNPSSKDVTQSNDNVTYAFEYTDKNQIPNARKFKGEINIKVNLSFCSK